MKVVQSRVCEVRVWVNPNKGGTFERYFSSLELAASYVEQNESNWLTYRVFVQTEVKLG